MSDVLYGISRIFLDSAPVIYFVESHPVYLSLLQPVFSRIEAGEIVAVTSPITLAECLVLPMRLGRTDAIEAFVDMLGGRRSSDFVPIQSGTAKLAADIRSRYNVTLTDAFQVATALEGKCDALLSNDKALSKITDLKVVLVEELSD